MSIGFTIQKYPVFEKGIFTREPTLFDHFYNSYLASFMNEQSIQTQEIVPAYEEKITWELVTGEGFCGANHPGTEKTFNTIMMRPEGSFSNGDCLYINPSQKIFAISDAPDMSVCSRRLLTRLDAHLHKERVEDLETIVNKLNKEIMTSDFDGATLSLVSLMQPGKAQVFIAGDSYLFCGNMLTKKMISIQGNFDFMGRTSKYIRAKNFDIKKSDFFIIASDGLMSIRSDHLDESLENILWNYINGNPENFVFRTIEDCNRIKVEKINDQEITRFGGYDNVSTLFIHPERLIDYERQESVMLGGYMMKLKCLVEEGS